MNSAFSERYPNVRVEVLCDQSERLVRALMDLQQARPRALGNAARGQRVEEQSGRNSYPGLRKGTFILARTASCGSLTCCEGLRRVDYPS